MKQMKPEKMKTSNHSKNCSPLSNSEREELEQLRFEKRERERKKADLEKAYSESLSQAKKQVEIPKDLSFPPAEKVLIIISVIIFLFAILYIAFAP